MMKKLALMVWVLFIPSVTHAALCSGNYYWVFMISPVENGIVSATIAFSEENVLSQGVMSLEYANGAIGTGSYTATSLFSISGMFDFYTADGDYYPFSFSAVTNGINFIGVGTVKDIITGDSVIGMVCGFFSGWLL